MALPPNEYPYEPLPPQMQDAIRLLVINPADNSEPLTGNFSVVSLDCSPRYEALSYVWGDPEKTEVLHTPEGCIRITASLHAALKRIRQFVPPHEENKHEPRHRKGHSQRPTAATVWADAVCINQENNTEKAHQVRLMGRIFSTANLVWAYLGEDSNDSDKAFAFLRSFQGGPSEDDGALFHATGPQTKFYTSLSMGKSATRAIFERSYFSRVWIIQEFVLAKRVVFICGSWYAGHSILLRSANFLSREMNSTATNIVETLFQLRSSYFEKEQRWPLIRILQHFRGHACTRASDHLFALLSLAGDMPNSELDPDYDEPVEETVRRYAKVFAKNGYMMELLNLAGHDPEPMERLRFPSWIPNWMSDFQDVAECVGSIHDWYPTRIDQGACSIVGDILQVNGCLIDEVFNVQSLGSTTIRSETLKLVEILDQRMNRRLARRLARRQGQQLDRRLDWWPLGMERSSLDRYVEIAGPLFDDICRFLAVPLEPRRSLISSRRGPNFTQLQGNMGSHLMDLIRGLPASAHLEKLRSFIEIKMLNDESFAWLATLFTDYRSWRAHRISVGLSSALHGHPLGEEHKDCQKCTDNSSEFDSYLTNLSSWIKSNKCFVTWVKKKLNGLGEEEKHQFIENLNQSEKERDDFSHLDLFEGDALYSTVSLLLHTFRLWRVFRTKCGKIGLGPLRTKIGDRLYITKAFRKPIIVRNIEGEEGMYRFIAVADIGSSKEFEDDEAPNEVLSIC